MLKASCPGENGKGLGRTVGIVLKDGGDWSFLESPREETAIERVTGGAGEEAGVLPEQGTSKARQGWEGLESSDRGGRHFLRVPRAGGRRQALACGSAETAPRFQSGRI